MPPGAYIASRIAQHAARSMPSAADLFALSFTHQADYLASTPCQTLIALVHLAFSAQGNATISLTLFPRNDQRVRELTTLPASVEAVRAYCQAQGFPWVCLSSPLRLEPVHIPKPWGQEIWYTGIEQRGFARVKGEGGSLPLPWVLECMGERLALSPGESLILLKVLDPYPEPGYGDLYFELHEQKQEVYVVTRVDPQAWPTGRGSMQLGFDPVQRQAYASQVGFKRAYLEAVRAYEQVRRRIDALVDAQREQEGIGLQEPVPAPRLKSWINKLSQQFENKTLFNEEQALKQAMNAFVGQQTLTLGDVVIVPRLMPHALQHGVQVVEFQSPVYERKILSFGQKVLTQDTWDTADALTLVDLDAVPCHSPELLLEAEGICVERIVHFDEFEVRRIRLEASLSLGAHHYSVLMVVEGSVFLEAGGQSWSFQQGEVILLDAQTDYQATSSACVLLQAISANRSES